MKVLHILDSLNRGGAEMLELDVCRNAKANGLDLIFAATGGGDLEDEFRGCGVEFVRLQRRMAVDLRLAAQLRTIIKTNNVKLVHSHQAVEALHAYLATRATDVKQAMTFHLCRADRKNTRALRFLAPRMNANIAVSHDLLNCLSTEAGFDKRQNFYVVHNGVDGERLKPAGSNLRAKLGMGASDILLGMIGNFYADRRKDQMTVCQSLPQVFAAMPAARFVFVGGPEANAPEVFDECIEYCRTQGIADRVRFAGKRADVPDVLAALDVFVFSSLADSFGIAVVEAMMAGLPTVASDIASLREVTGDGQYAMLFRLGDPNDLAAKLIQLMNDTSVRREFGAKGRQWASEKFSIQTHIENLIALYDKIAGKS
jgi:L-malate glycosyltransferase